MEHESGELMRKLDDLLAPDAFEYLSSSSRRSVDGVVHVVAIRPWSESAAAHIRALAAPITVTIETPDHDQPDQPTSVGLPVHGRDHEHESR